MFKFRNQAYDQIFGDALREYNAKQKEKTGRSTTIWIISSNPKTTRKPSMRMSFKLERGMIPESSIKTETSQMKHCSQERYWMNIPEHFRREILT